MFNKNDSVLVSKQAEMDKEYDRYFKDILKAETEDDLTMAIAHHIINTYDIIDKYAAHEQEIYENGISL